MVARKRVYEEPSSRDGFRVLVERLWPRGISKERAKLDLWLRDVAPSTELRQWYGHDPAKWAEFHRRYLAELGREPAASALQALLDRAERGTVTLVYAARDEEHSNPVVLQEYLEKHLPRRAKRAA